MFHVPEQFRVEYCTKSGLFPAPNQAEKYGNNGLFSLSIKGHISSPKVFIIASDGEGWEHVSVSITNSKRCPTWEEMCFIKNMFWDSDDAVVQFHPSEKDYVNNHPYCLHLWRPTNQILPTPDPLMVGIKSIA